MSDMANKSPAELIALARECAVYEEFPELLESLASALEAAQADAERLDWLEAQGMGTDPRAWSVWAFEPNVRAAIDAARKRD